MGDRLATKLATKLVNNIKHLSYENRFKKLTLKYRRLRGDMIEVYKIIHGNRIKPVL